MVLGYNGRDKIRLELAGFVGLGLRSSFFT